MLRSFLTVLLLFSFCQRQIYSEIESVNLCENEKIFNVETKLEYFHEYQVNGSLQGRGVIVPTVLFQLKCAENCFVYNKIASHLQTRSEYQHLVDISAGIDYFLNDYIIIDSGFLYHWKPNQRNGFLGQSREWYVGLDSNLILQPKIYFYYDFDRQQMCLKSSFGYRFDLEGFGLKYWAIDTKIFGGILFSRNAYAGIRGKRKNGYKFFGSSCHLVYQLQGFGEIWSGFEFSANTDGRKSNSVANEFGKHGKLFSWTFGFSLVF